MFSYCIERIGDEEEGITFNILIVEGQEATTVASCFDRPFAEQIVSALRWQDTLGEMRISLTQEGVSFDSVTGKATSEPKKRTRARTKGTS